jgi:hypothetical protein
MKSKITLVNRFKIDIINIGVIGILFGLIFSLLYPGEESMHVFYNALYESALAGFFGSIGSENSPGWVFWLSIIFGFFFYFIFALAGINLGAKIIPTVENDGIDVVLTHTPHNARKIFRWNYLTALVSIIILILPTVLLISIFSVIYSSAFIVDEILYSLIIYFGCGIFFLSLTSVSSILRFSKSTGKIVGFGYLIFTYILDIVSSAPEYSDYANLSINHYLNGSQVLFLGCSQENFLDIWGPFFVILVISSCLFLIGLWRVKYPDFIERVKDLSPSQSVFTLNLWKKFFSPDSFLAKKYPIFMNQLERNLRTMLLVLLLIAFQQYAVFNALPSPGELIEQLAQGNNNIFSAFSQNHLLPNSLLGFLIIKFYALLWVFYGIPVVMIAAKIPTKDVDTSTHDLLFANNLSPSRVVLSRIMSLIVSFTILVWGSFIALRGIQSTATELDLSLNLQAQVFTIIWIHFLSLGIFMTGIASIPKVSNGKRFAIFIFIFFIIMSVIPFLNSDFEFLKYLSFLNYFDPVGLIVEDVTFQSALSISLVVLGCSILFTYLIVKFKYSRSDLR